MSISYTQMTAPKGVAVAMDNGLKVMAEKMDPIKKFLERPKKQVKK